MLSCLVFVRYNFAYQLVKNTRWFSWTSNSKMAELIKDVSGEKDGTQVAVQIHDLRKKYFNSEEPIVLERNMDQDPFIQFDKWFKNVAAQTEMSFEEVNAVNISTCVNNKPSSRMVLLKEYSSQGFTFYTNSVSKKGHDLKINPNAAMLFYWPKVDRQIRIEGVVSVQDEQIALNYWNKRPLASRISNMLSEQSSVVPSRQYLEDKKLELEKQAQEHGPAAITKPKTWLGYTLKPDYFEFWQGQSNRLHDRIVYEKVRQDNEDNVVWTMKRLAP